jgi:hypothetical protein
VLLVPLVLASLTRPFALWDYLTAQTTLQLGDPFSPAQFFRNCLHNFFQATPTARPVNATLTNLHYLVLGGEFWAWYLVKWAAKFAAVWGVVRLLPACGVLPAVRFAVASLLLFHPASFELMLFSADGWVALFAVLCLVCSLQFSPGGKRILDMTAWPWPRYALLYVLWAAALGAKEAGAVFALVWLALAHFDSPRTRRFLVRVSLFYVTLAWFAWKLAVSARLRVSNFDSAAGVSIHWHPLLDHIRLLFPVSRFDFLGLAVLAVLAVSLKQILRAAPQTRRLYAVCVLWAIGSLLFISTATYAAPRYIVPIVFALGVPFGIGLSGLAARSTAVCWLFALGFPLLTAGDLYRQALAYQQYCYEVSDVLTLVQQ